MDVQSVGKSLGLISWPATRSIERMKLLVWDQKWHFEEDFQFYSAQAGDTIVQAGRTGG